jgi:hypothetical protein
VSRQPGTIGTDTAWDLQRALLDYLESNWQRPHCQSQVQRVQFKLRS